MSEQLPTTIEEWRPVPGYPNYEASTLGRVRSYCNCHAGRKKEPHIISQSPMAGGYLKIQLWLNGVMIYRSVHRIVALTFLPIDPARLEVNHKDGNKTANHVQNLEWATSSENMRHSFRVLGNKAPHGEKHRSAKLTEHDVHAIFALKQTEKISNRKLAKRFNVASQTIDVLLLGKTWRHLKLR